MKQCVLFVKDWLASPPSEFRQMKNQIGYLFLTILLTTFIIPVAAQEQLDSDIRIDRQVIRKGFDGKTCWVHARTGLIPADAQASKSQSKLVMTTQPLLLSGSDTFYALNELSSNDGGESWTSPEPMKQFRRQTFPATGTWLSAEAKQLLKTGDEVTVCDFAPQWHAASQRLLGIGQTVWYRNNRVMKVRPRGIAYAVYQPNSNTWSNWKTVKLPAEKCFLSAGSGSVQRVDLVGGDSLIPFYFKEPQQKQYSVAVARCRFDGQDLHFVELGNRMTIPVVRGLYEPSLIQFQGKFYLTMRNDKHGYVCQSDDGLNFDKPKRWKFDDGKDLGNYNTQQHWAAIGTKLYLLYTRKGAQNDHVFRHRAPLFIAQVDPQKLHVKRATEKVVVPERGARLGNFGVTRFGPNESWVTVTEWMQPIGVEKHGSDNSIYIARIKTKESAQQAPSKPTSGNADSRWNSIASYFKPPAAFHNRLNKKNSPLQFNDGRTVKTKSDWQERRSELKAEWETLLGKWPQLLENQKLKLLTTVEKTGYTQHRIRFRWLPDQSTEGYLLVPKKTGRLPAVVTVFYEPETSIGLGRPNRAFGLDLVKRGFVVLSIGTTAATKAQTYSLYYPTLEQASVQPLSMLGYAAANAWHVLANHEKVDAKRIGIVGHSFGGKWAMFGACQFERFACAAWSDPGIVFDESRPSVNYWEPWYLGYHSKPWRKRGVITKQNPAKGLYPQLVAQGRDLHELHALMAPRPFLVSGGSEDPVSRWEALNHSVKINQILGYHNRVAMTNRPDHSPNQDSNEVIYRFFEHFLFTE